MKKMYSLKLVFVITLQFALIATLLAQAPLPKQWDYRFGGTKNDVLNSLQQTKDGGYILGGWSNSNITGDKTQDSRGSYDYWIVKINANGVKQWNKRFGGTDRDYLNSLQQTTDGGYILGGYSYSGIGGDKTEASRGHQDYWILKTDAYGNKQWDKRFGGTSYDYLNVIRQTTDGGYILGGYSYSGIGGDKTEESRGGSDYWIVKLNASGVKQWDKRFGGNFDDLLYSLQQTSDGGYILGGASDSEIGGDKTEASRGGQDYWIVKINANGIKQWDKTFGGTLDDYLTSLQQTTDGGYILGGASSSGIGGDKTQASRGNDDFWIIKINANGSKQWDERYGGAQPDNLSSLQQTTEGGFILGGSSFSGSNGDKTQTSRGDYDFWIVKTNVNGKKEWDARFGGRNGDELHSLQQTKDGGYILGGPSSSEISGDKTQSKRGDSNPYIYDYWVLKLGCPPSAKVAAVNGNDLCLTNYPIELIADASPDVEFQWLKNGLIIPGANSRKYNVKEPGRYRVVVYTSKECSQLSDVINIINSCGETGQKEVFISPNPSHGIINVAYNSNIAGSVQLYIYNKTGKVMFAKTESAIKGNNTYQLNLSHLINGMYNLQMTNGSEQSRATFVIEK